MIEHIQRPADDLQIPLCADIVPKPPEYFRNILHVDILIENRDELGEHHLAHAPYRVHHFARLPWDTTS